MTIGDMRKAWRDLPDSTNIEILDARPDVPEYRDVESLEIERTLHSEPDGPTDNFIIRLSE